MAHHAFDYSKALQELGYTTRHYQKTIRDEVSCLKEEVLI